MVRPIVAVLLRRAARACDRLANAISPPTGSSATVTRTTSLCQTWLRVDEEMDALQTQWQLIEVRLTEREAADSSLDLAGDPDALRLREIDNRLDQLAVQQRALFASLPSVPTLNLGDIAAKLSVLLHLIHREDAPEVYALLTALHEDVGRLGRPSCGALP